MARRSVSKRAREYISRKVRKLLEEGYAPDQAVAIAYSYARRRRFKVGKATRRKKRT